MRLNLHRLSSRTSEGGETSENALAPAEPCVAVAHGPAVDGPVCPTIRLLLQALRGASDAAFVLDATGAVLTHNTHFDQLFGLPRCVKDHDTCNGSISAARVSEKPTSRNISSLLTFSGGRSWPDVCNSLTSAEQSCSVVIIQHDKGRKLSGSARLSKLDPCPCCNRTYFVAHVCASGTSRSESFGNSDEFRRLKRIQDTIDASFDAMFEINEKGSILMVNNAAADIFGYTCDELMGSNISIICGKKHAKYHDQYLARYLKTGKTKIMGKKREVAARKKSGEEFPVELGIKEIQTEEDGRVFCAFIKDKRAGHFCPFCLATYCDS